MSAFLGLFNYWVVIFLFVFGLYMTMTQPNLIKKLIGISILQTSVFIFFIGIAYQSASLPPIAVTEDVSYSNPLPHVLILTAIVVAVSTTAVGLALVVRMQRAFGSIDEEEILEHLDKDY